MKDSVTVKLARRDILAFHLYLFPRLRGNWVFLGILFLALFGLLLLAERPSGAREYSIAALASAIGAVLGWLAGLFVHFRRQSNRRGASPLQRFTLEEDGLREETGAGDTVYEWKSVSALRKTAQFIVVSVDSSRHILIPRREFASKEAFDAFYERASRLLWKRRSANSG